MYTHLFLFHDKGALALRALLSGATPIYSSGKRIRNFEKNGNYFTALKDFESVDPHDVVHLTTRTGVSFQIFFFFQDVIL